MSPVSVGSSQAGGSHQPPGAVNELLRSCRVLVEIAVPVAHQLPFGLRESVLGLARALAQAESQLSCVAVRRPDVARCVVPVVDAPSDGPTASLTPENAQQVADIIRDARGLLGALEAAELAVPRVIPLAVAEATTSLRLSLAAGQ